MSEKFCIDCRYCVRFNFHFDNGMQVEYQCMNPNQERDLVTGLIKHTICKEQRDSVAGVCGKNAIWFEPWPKGEGIRSEMTKMPQGSWIKIR